MSYVYFKVWSGAIFPHLGFWRCDLFTTQKYSYDRNCLKWDLCALSRIQTSSQIDLFALKICCMCITLVCTAWEINHISCSTDPNIFSFALWECATIMSFKCDTFYPKWTQIHTRRKPGHPRFVWISNAREINTTLFTLVRAFEQNSNCVSNWFILKTFQVFFSRFILNVKLDDSKWINPETPTFFSKWNEMNKRNEMKWPVT